jgi:hypothetical protein
MSHKEGPQFLNPPRHGAPHAALFSRRALLAGPAAALCTKVMHAVGYTWTTEPLGISAFCGLLRDDCGSLVPVLISQPAASKIRRRA